MGVAKGFAELVAPILNNEEKVLGGSDAWGKLGPGDDAVVPLAWKTDGPWLGGWADSSISLRKLDAESAVPTKAGVSSTFPFVRVLDG